MSVIAVVTIEDVQCGACGIWFGMEQNMLKKVRENGNAFFCPKGCNISYCKSENQRLKDELAREKQRAEQIIAHKNVAIEHYRTDRDEIKKTLTATKAAKTRLKNRIAVGVCPCCTRHFTNLSRHIETKHPEFKQEQQ